MSDLIRREDIFSKFEEACTCGSIDKNGMKWGEIKTVLTWEGIRKILENIPSAEPERRKGKWVEINRTPSFIWLRCSECGYGANGRTNFCPHCGADMRDEDASLGNFEK